MNTSPPQTSYDRFPLLWGTLLGVLSAVGYTAANIFLRSAIDCDPILVSTIKALPASVALGGWLLWQTWKSQARVLPRRSVMLKLILAGLLGQFGGNVMFQYALGVVGIALTVPLCLGSIILSSALLGRIFLQEAVHTRTIISMVTLVVAIWALSAGADQASQSLDRVPASSLTITLSLLASVVAGLSYAVLGVVIRYSVMGRSSVAATTWITSVVGLVCLGIVALLQQGVTGLSAVSGESWSDMMLAGVCNFIAFLALTKALQLTTLIYVNALNASQVAMAAVAGVVIFAEPLSPSLGSGVLLTVLGLLLMPRSSRKAMPSEAQRPTDFLKDEGVENSRNECSNSSSRSSSQSESEPVVVAETGSKTASSSAGSSSACDGR